MGFMMPFASTSQSIFLWALFDITGGALAGIFMPGLLYAMIGGRRDFTSQSQVVTLCHTVFVSVGIDQAFELLQRGPGNRMRPRPARRWLEPKGPNEYGSRPDEKSRLDVQFNDEDEDGGAEVSEDNEHTVSAQEPAETAVELAEDS